ncbi:MAG: type II toxin-antitoxin system RelE/ParE family toxin [Armatimonadota bacterium]
MKREWVFFERDSIRAELDDLPAKDAAKLVSLMEHYRDVGTGNQIDDYGNGIYRLRHIKSAYQGRLLYFAVERTFGFERLVVLAVYKKESKSVPKTILDRAHARKRKFESKEK